MSPTGLSPYSGNTQKGTLYLSGWPRVGPTNDTQEKVKRLGLRSRTFGGQLSYRTIGKLLTEVVVGTTKTFVEVFKFFF